MSIPYLPGWWDEISKNATGLAQQLPQFIQPDRVANKKLQEMVQQNPMILEQMGNMDAGTRSLLEQSLGFKKQSPVSQLPVGAERQMREMNMGLLNETLASPEGKQDYLKKTLGRRTNTDLKKEQQELAQGAQALKFNDLNFEKLSGDVQIGKLLNAEKERNLKKLNEIRLQSGGRLDPQRVASAIASGRPTQTDLEMYSVIKNEPGMGEALDSTIEFLKLGMQHRNSLSLRVVGQQDDFLRMAMGTVAQAASEYKNAAQMVNAVTAKNKIAGVSLEEALAADPTLAQQFQQAIQIRDEAKGRLDMYRPLVQKGFEKYGVKFPEIDVDSSGPNPEQQTDPLAQAAYDAIKARPDKAAQIRASYKAKTNKDLP